MIDLVKLVKENLPSNVSLTEEPYKAKLSKNLIYIHGYNGYVFHIKHTFSDGDSHEEMLFVSFCKNKAFHNVISLFDARVEELSDRCYWINEEGIEKVGFRL